MGDQKQIERLRALLRACHDVLPDLDRPDVTADDALVQAIRETCNEIEARLRSLGAEVA